MFKRVKSKPTQRTRSTSPDRDAEAGLTPSISTDTVTEREESPLSAVKKAKERVKKSKPKSKLSFGGEEEDSGGEVFQLKKSSLSRKLTLGKHPANIPENLDQATISPHRGPTYDQAYLNELKKSTPSSRQPPAADAYDADVSMDLGDVSMTTVETVDVFQAEPETVIHSESSIKQAKDRRERARVSQTSGQDDYISLSVTRREDQGPHPESRLVREEDELGEGDDEFAEYTSAQERIALGKKSRKIEASKRRELMKELISDVAEDEESAEWEQEQLRRGGHIPSDSPSSAKAKVKEVYRPAPIPPAAPIPSLGPALSRLTQQLAQLTTSHATNTAALNTLAQEREQVDEREKEMRVLVERAEEKRAWFSSFRDWVESVAAFLDEKYPLLEELEEEHVSLLKERFNMISKRREQDDEDDLSAFLGPLPVAPPSHDEMDDTDELGRSIPKPDPPALRRERQEARSVRYHRQQEYGSVVEEGYWTDSELSPSDETAYRTALASVATRTHDILSDVKSKEFLDPAKGRWSMWRERYSDSYVAAFGGLGVVSAWEFWARLESVGWNFIEEPKSLDSFRWYHGLYQYCRPGNVEEEDREFGPEGDLVSSMVSTAILPRLTKLIEGGALDVYSSKHIRRAIDLAEEIEATVTDLEQGNLKLQAFLKSIIICFDQAISETLSLFSKYTSAAVSRGAHPFDPEAIPARQRFLARQVKLLTNLLRWRKFTGERFGAGQLATKLIDGSLLGVADGGWEVGGEDAVKKVAVMLPKELITPGIKSRLNL